MPQRAVNLDASDPPSRGTLERRITLALIEENERERVRERKRTQLAGRDLRATRCAAVTRPRWAIALLRGAPARVTAPLIPTPLLRDPLRMQPRVPPILAPPRTHQPVPPPLEPLAALDAPKLRRRHPARLVGSRDSVSVLGAPPPRHCRPIGRAARALLPWPAAATAQSRLERHAAHIANDHAPPSSRTRRSNHRASHTDQPPPPWNAMR